MAVPKGTDRKAMLERAALGLCTQCDNPRTAKTSKCSECLSKNYIQLKEDNPNHVRDVYYKTSYGITVTEVEAMIETQDHLCWICDEPLNGDFVVDHDHGCCPNTADGNIRSCGRCIRGVAHRFCNTKLSGRFEDPEFLRTLADKIERRRNNGTT